VAQSVRADGLVDTGAATNPSHDPFGAVTVHPLPVESQEDRAVEAFADGKVDRPCGPGCERDGDDLSSLAQHSQGAVTAFDTEGVDVSTEGLGDPQAVDREQRDQCVLARGAESGGDQQRADLVAVQRRSRA
jgi:hypothetical protein